MTDYEKYIELFYVANNKLFGQARVDFMKSVIDEIKEQGKKDLWNKIKEIQMSKGSFLDGYLCLSHAQVDRIEEELMKGD